MNIKLATLFLIVCFIFSLSACKQHGQRGAEGGESVDLISTKGSERYYEMEVSIDNEPIRFRQYYNFAISNDEYKIVETALRRAPTEKLRSAQAYLIVLLRAIQETKYSDVQIISANIISYPLPEKNYEDGTPYKDMIISIEKAYGCDEYAVQIIDALGNEFIVWDSYVYEKVICNGEEIHSYYHVMF